MTATDAQIRIAMSERKKGKTQQQAAATANLASRKTVAKYEQVNQFPSQMRQIRTYRTRQDPFVEDWTSIEQMLRDAPELEAKAVFEWLCEKHPQRYKQSQLRTLQRRFASWRAMNKQQVATLEQVREPGKMLQVDGTWMTKLNITIEGTPFTHILIHCVLPYSNWEWGRIAQSESLGAVQDGVSSTLLKLGYVPEIVQTDNSSAATKRLGITDESQPKSKRAYTQAWQHLCDHYGLKPQTTHLSSPNENGDVESSNGSLKRAVKQALLLRGSREFVSIDAYETFLFAVMEKRNRLRQGRLNEELPLMKPLRAHPLARREVRTKVNSASLIRVQKKLYSLPTSLIGRTVRVIIREWTVEVYFNSQLVTTAPRLIGQEKYCVNYRHVVGSLLRKPGGFRQYRYRDAMFPMQVFRQVWEQLDQWHSSHKADLTYLRILNLAATEMECEVAEVLETLLEKGERFDEQGVEALIRPRLTPSSTATTLHTAPVSIDLQWLDQLLPEVAYGTG